MEFKKTDFEALHNSKVNKSLYDDTICSRYFFCLEDKMIFINRSRCFYKILASCQCHFESIYRERVFEVIYITKDFDNVVSEFKLYCETTLSKSFVI